MSPFQLGVSWKCGNTTQCEDDHKENDQATDAVEQVLWTQATIYPLQECAIERSLLQQVPKDGKSVSGTIIHRRHSVVENFTRSTAGTRALGTVSWQRRLPE